MIVSAVYIYPVKSCRGILIQEAEVTPSGFRHDREFLVVDADGTFLTQRTTPALALVDVQLADNGLRLCAPDSAPIQLPWHSGEPARLATVKIWRDTVNAWDAGDEAAAWFSRYLGRTCRVARMGDGFRREVPEAKVPEPHREALRDPVVSFADAFPFLIASETSLHDLNSRLDRPIPMDRFRPNIVIGGCDRPYAEDGWQVIRIGTTTFRHGGPCVRCVVTTTDQRTLERGPEPLRTLASYRRVPEGGVIFAVNFFSERHDGIVRVGAPVEVLASEERPIGAGGAGSPA
jgi:uncharacterized protein